jgi:hypothetical protein
LFHSARWVLTRHTEPDVVVFPEKKKEKQTELMIITRSSLDQARSHLLTERRIKMNEENDDNQMKKTMIMK